MKGSMRFLTTLGLAFLAQNAFADPTWTQNIQEMGANAAKGYAEPMQIGLGTGMNSQWDYSSKTQSFMGLPVGISFYVGYPIVMVSNGMKTFDFNGTIPSGALLNSLTASYPTVNVDSLAQTLQSVTGKSWVAELDSVKNENLKINVKGVPTIYGSDKKKSITLADLLSGSHLGDLVTSYNHLADSINPIVDSLSKLGISTSYKHMTKVNTGDSIQLPFAGINTPIAPTLPPIGVNVGFSHIPVLDNITLGARWVPTVSNSKLGSVGMLGFTVQHELTPEIPVLSHVPFLHFGMMYGYNSFSISANSNGTEAVSIKSTNQIGMLTFSIDPKFPVVSFGVFGGIGYEASDLSLNVQALHFVTQGDTLTVPAFTLDLNSQKSLRTQIGLRLTLGVFDIYGSMDNGITTTYNVGVAVGLNGL